MRIELKTKRHERRKQRIRKKVFGTPERPRLTIFRSSRHIYAQIIDDMAGLTLASASTGIKTLRNELKSCSNRAAAEAVGTAIAKQAISVGIKAVCFDRNGFRYHGRVKALADAARKAGLAL